MQLRQSKILYDALLTDRDRLLLKFNDRHVVDSDSELMADLRDSDQDLLDD